jgi:putative ABC transport system permease protein
MKKVLGASRKSLIFQFLSETILLSFAALIIALILVEIFLPGFSNLLNTNISLYSSGFPRVLMLLLFTGLFTGLLAGVYPAFFLSGFSPLKVLKGGIFSISKGKYFRNSLVVIQFFLATGLIICTLTVYRQISFFGRQDLGFDRGNYLVLSLTGETSKKDYRQLKTRFESLPYVQSVGSSTAIPGTGLTRNGYIPEENTEAMMFHVIDVDSDYLATLGIEIIDGEAFVESQNFSDDILINQALARKLNWNNPIGKTISRNGSHKIIGVVNDFHFAPLHHAIAPLIITNKPWEGYEPGFDYVTIRLNEQNTALALADAENIWHELFPSEPFVFNFMDQMQQSVYTGEKTFGQLFTWASVLAIFIAGLGLFGLTTFITQQRRKEIGIRKTFGANPGRIVWLLGRQFISLVVLGNMLAWPFAWMIMQKWLENFALKPSFGWWIYGVTLLISVIFAFITVAWQSIKSSLQNPVDSLRYE